MTRVDWRETLWTMVLLAFAAAPILLEGQAQRGGMMAEYDKAAEVTVNAVVKDVKLMTPGEGMGGGRMGQGQMREGGAASEGAAAGGMQGRMGRGAMDGPMGGAHIIVDADGTALEVMLGPLSFMTQQNYTFAVGDRLSITGVRTNRGQTEMLMPRLIRRGETTMTFRDESGRPLWMGKR
jgi:hypothetical protein